MTYLFYSKSVVEHISHLEVVFEVLRKHKLYEKLEKRYILVPSVAFLGYIVSKDGVSIDPSKVEAIKSWSVPITISRVRSFHDLASFYRRFVRDFSCMVAPMIKCINKGKFEWTKVAHKIFEAIKRLLCDTHILALLDFSSPFKVECDASGVGIGVMLVQKKRS